MTRVAVVILNYNGEKLLQRFLPFVIQFSPEASIYVADNGSSDESVALLQHQFPQVKILELGKNLGFCSGYNTALRQIPADYYLLLNSDVEVTPNWLEPLVSILDSNPGIAAIQPKILSHANKSYFEYAGAAGGFLDTLGYPFCRGRVFDHLEKDFGQYNDDRQIFWATGACLLIRGAKFHACGGFDEDLFAHMEEIDLCWKLNRSNNSIYYSAKSTVYHVGAGTLGYDHPRKTYLNFRNGLSLIFKHMDTRELLYKLPFRMFLDWLAAIFFLISGEGKKCKSVFRAHVDFFTQLHHLKRKRVVIRAKYKRYPRKSIYPGLILFDYFLRKKKTSPFQ